MEKKMRRSLKWTVFFVFVLLVTSLIGRESSTVFANDVVYISKPEEMRVLYNTNPNTSYMLLNDIDMKNFGFWESPDFKGKEFSGNGFAIRNLISRKNGLFNSIPAGCHIHDVAIIGAKVNVKGTFLYMGGIAGYINEENFLSTTPITIIERCFVDDSTYFNIEGQSAYLLDDVELDSEVYFGSIIGEAYAGKYKQRVNNVDFEIDSKIFIKNCVGFSNWEYTSSYPSIGGIVGNTGNRFVDDEQNSIFIENCIGSFGIVGKASYTRINHCIAIEKTRKERNNGGLAGVIDDKTFISNSYYLEEPAFHGGGGVTFPTLYKIDGNTDFTGVMGDRWLAKRTYKGIPIPDLFLKYFKVDKPINFYPDATYNNTYPKETGISLSHPWDNATIYYTTDGSEPTVKSAVYKEPILLTENMTVKAIATYWDMMPSDVYTASYTVEIPEKKSESQGEEKIRNNNTKKRKHLNHIKLYRNYIKKTGIQLKNFYRDSYFIYLDKDSVPEILLTNGAHASGSTILYIYNGKVKKAGLIGSLDGYIKGKGKMVTSSSGFGNIITAYYSLKRGKIKTKLVLQDGGSEPVGSSYYGFFINNKEVSEKTFRKKEKQMEKENKKYRSNPVEIKELSKFGLRKYN